MRAPVLQDATLLQDAAKCTSVGESSSDDEEWFWSAIHHLERETQLGGQEKQSECQEKPQPQCSSSDDEPLWSAVQYVESKQQQQVSEPSATVDWSPSSGTWKANLGTHATPKPKKKNNAAEKCSPNSPSRTAEHPPYKEQASQ